MQLRREKTEGRGRKKALTCFRPNYEVEAIKYQRKGTKGRKKGSVVHSALT